MAGHRACQRVRLGGGGSDAAAGPGASALEPVLHWVDHRSRGAPRDLYSATKAAVATMAEAIRLEVEGRGVQVCVVHPGLVDTPLAPDGHSGALLDPGDVAAELLRLADAERRFDVNERALRARLAPVDGCGARLVVGRHDEGVDVPARPRDHERDGVRDVVDGSSVRPS